MRTLSYVACDTLGQYFTWYSNTARDTGSITFPTHPLPAITVVYPAGGELLTGNRTLKWQTANADVDTLTMDVFLDGSGGPLQLASGLTATTLDFDTATVPAGAYALRIVGTDGVATVQGSSGTFTIFRAGRGTWIGASGGDWDDPGNWPDGIIPTASDTVTIGADVLVITYANEPAPAFSTLVLGDAQGSSHPTLVLSKPPEGTGSVEVHSGATLTFNMADQATLASLTLDPGAVLNHSPNATERSFVVNLEVLGTMNVEAGASVNLAGLGYAGAGPGVGGTYHNSIGCGGGHGGAGGDLSASGIDCAPGQPYDSETSPTDLGSSGGPGGDPHRPSTPGAGGGAILLKANDLIVDGRIDVGGASPSGGPYGCYRCGGGGSGGTIDIIATTISGSGSLSANGGSVPSSGMGGAGGGGRIAVTRGTDNSNLSISAGGGGGSRSGGAGAPGTIYLASAPTDSIPPTTTAVLSPVPDASGWERSDTALLLSATDNSGGSGVKSITFASSGALSIVSTTVAGSSASINFTVEGIVTVTFHSVDNAGNVEAEQAITLLIDKTAPQITASAAPAPNGAGWNMGDVTISFSCSDALSGVAGCSEPVVLAAEGVGQSAIGVATDLAGNPANTSAAGINIDKTPPTVTVQRTPVANAYGWNNTAVTATFTCSDALSGVFSCPIPTLLDEGAAQSASGTAVDLAGNTASASVGGINVDKTPPLLTLPAPGTVIYCAAKGNPVAACSGRATAVFNVRRTDALSGIASSSVLLDGAAVAASFDSTGTASIAVQGLGRHTLSLTAADRAGNVATLSSTVYLRGAEMLDDDDAARLHIRQGRTLEIELEVRFGRGDAPPCTKRDRCAPPLSLFRRQVDCATLAPTGPEEDADGDSPAGDDRFRVDALGKSEYQARLALRTKTFSAGSCYRLTAFDGPSSSSTPMAFAVLQVTRASGRDDDGPGRAP